MSEITGYIDGRIQTVPSRWWPLRNLNVRKSKRAASDQRQRLLAAFWNEEKERLWPMLRGSFEKQSHWDEWNQFSEKMHRIVKETGCTAEQAANHLRFLGWNPRFPIVLTNPDGGSMK